MKTNIFCAYCNRIVWFWQKKYYASFCGQCCQVSHYKCVKDAGDLIKEDLAEIKEQKE